MFRNVEEFLWGVGDMLKEFELIFRYKVGCVFVFFFYFWWGVVFNFRCCRFDINLGVYVEVVW